jgi:hypothetical protein
MEELVAAFDSAAANRARVRDAGYQPLEHVVPPALAALRGRADAAGGPAARRQGAERDAADGAASLAKGRFVNMD